MIIYDALPDRSQTEDVMSTRSLSLRKKKVPFFLRACVREEEEKGKERLKVQRMGAKDRCHDYPQLLAKKNRPPLLGCHRGRKEKKRHATWNEGPSGAGHGRTDVIAGKKRSRSLVASEGGRRRKGDSLATGAEESDGKGAVSCTDSPPNPDIREKLHCVLVPQKREKNNL